MVKLKTLSGPRVAVTTGGLTTTYEGSDRMSKRICSIPGCTNPHKARGWCLKHYNRWNHRGDPEAPDQVDVDARSRVCKVVECPKQVSAKGYCKTHYITARRAGEFGPIPTCSVEDCSKPARAHSYCATHYRQWRDGRSVGHIQPQGGSVESRFWARVERGPACWLWTGSQTTDGYGSLYELGASVRAHRLSYELHYGAIQEGLVIDHMCHNRACVNPSHLRAVPQQWNAQNLGKINSNSTTGVRGVSWNKARKSYVAYGSIDGKGYQIGYFSALKDASNAASDWRKRNYPGLLSQRVDKP